MKELQEYLDERLRIAEAVYKARSKVMTEAEQVDLGMRVHSVSSHIDAIVQAAATNEGRDELGMMLKSLTVSYWELGKVLRIVGYATSNAAE